MLLSNVKDTSDMFEKADLPCEDSVGAGGYSPEKARRYDYLRFGRRRRMRRLDGFEKKFAEDLLDLVGTDSCIVDVPCGNGRFFDVFSAARKLILADYSENMLCALQAKHGKRENVRHVRADICELPLDDDSADLCFCMRLFHHMKTDEIRLKALGELRRITRKYVALSFYNKSCLRYYYRRALGKKIRGNYVTGSHMMRLACQAGLECVERRPSLNFIEQQCLLIFKKNDKRGG